MSATRTRIMYIQRGRESARIGRVHLSKTGRTLTYGALDDVREEYWRDMRRSPASATLRSFRSRGVHGNHSTR